MISIALAFLIGVLTLMQFRTLPDAQWLWLLLLVTVPVLYSKNLWIKCLAACSCGFLYGLFISHQVLGTHLATELEGQDVLVTGRIVDFPVHKERAIRFLFSVEDIQHQGKSHPAPGKVRLSWYYATAVPKVGERWQFLVRLKQPHGFMNPGGFDYETWLFQQRIRATGYVRQQHEPVRLAESSGIVLWQRLRFSLYEKIQQLALDRTVTGLLTALAIGERDGITASQWTVLRHTGTAHLMAISGLHIGLLATLGYGLGNWLWRLRSSGLNHLPAQQFAAITAMVFAFVYSALAGFSIPTQRALIMVSVVMLAILRRRFIQPSQVLAQSLLLVLIVDPLSVLSAGFWLSFAAVAVILYGLNNRIAVMSKWRSLVRMQWIVVLGLLPLTIGLFQQASIVSPLTNLLAIPVVSFIVVPLTLLSCALMFIYEPLAIMVLMLSAQVMEVLWQVLQWASGLSFSQIQLAASKPALVLAAMGVALFISPRGIPSRYIGLVFCLPLLFPVVQRPNEGEVWLSLLDVGQGLAAVIQTRGHTLIYDTGPRFSDSFNTGEAVVAPYLRQAGSKQIDLLMVSHGDNDHIGGANALANLFPINRILSSVPQKLPPNAQRCQQGQEWSWDGVRFRVVHPASDYVPKRREANNLSCVLRVESKYGSILLTGDIEQEAESQLIHQHTAVRSDVLVVPHHGSLTSSSMEFIEAVSPQLALFPVGYRNRYRLPNQKILARYGQVQAQTDTTALSGRILVTFSQQSQPLVSRFRSEASRFWHHPYR